MGLLGTVDCVAGCAAIHREMHAERNSIMYRTCAWGEWNKSSYPPCPEDRERML